MGNEGTMRLGLIINPVAGLGGRVGLKGSDGAEIQQKALALGAKPCSQQRTLLALEVLVPVRERLELLTAPAEMGENMARQSGFAPTVVGAGARPASTTSAEDTMRAGREMLIAGVD